MTLDLAALAAPFASDQIHWRAQTMNGDGTSAMALAYIDARDVMQRLDEVCGPANWQDSYTETAKGRLLCTLSLRIDGEWISKCDGAGDTDVEGDKGAISDSLKRAAVKWGIGRHLYDMPVTWAECESYERNGKKHWKKWSESGLRKLQSVRVGNPALAKPAVIDDAQWAEITTLISSTNSNSVALCEHYRIASLKEMTVGMFNDAATRLRKRLPTPEQKAA